MSNNGQLSELLKRPDVWKAGRRSVARGGSIPTGFPELDRVLGGGWPGGQLTELATPAHGPAHGIGELKLLMPAINRLDRWVMFVSPPYIPYAPALERYGLDLSRLLVVRAAAKIDTLWSMEQALRSGACSAVIAWAENAEERALRRLQLAAETGTSWAVLFRPSLRIDRRSPAPLRIGLHAHEPGGGLELRIVKQRSGLPATVWVNASDA